MTNDPKDLQQKLEKLRAAMSRGEVAVKSKKIKDQKDKQEELALSPRERAETQKIYEANRDARVNRRLRFDYAKLVFRYLVWYSIFAAVLLIFSGFKIFNFELPPIVLTAVVGSTAASAIGLVAAVVTGLFKK